MKLIFLCGCLEKGMDGVGDYVQRLGNLVAGNGVQIMYFALNDPYVKETFLITHNSIRCSHHLSWKVKVAKLSELLHSFQPDWISLQFVPYSFDKRGIVYNLVKFLPAILKNQRTHLMLHELWIDIDPHPGIKTRLIGYLQRQFVLSLIKKIQPLLISTSNTFYASLLKSYNLEAEVLPLLTNIPVNRSFDYQVFEKVTLIKLPEKKEYFVIAFFGSIHHGWDYNTFFNTLYRKAIEMQKKLMVLSIGKQGSGTDIWSELKIRFSDKVNFVHPGICSTEEVSDLLYYSNAGISTTPKHLLEKSGSFIAMIEHGLPVFVVRNFFPDTGKEKHPGVLIDVTNTPVELPLRNSSLLSFDDQVLEQFTEMLFKKY